MTATHGRKVRVTSPHFVDLGQHHMKRISVGWMAAARIRQSHTSGAHQP